MDYFIADLHFGHSNIISLCNRPYNSVEEMDEAFISAWNARVKKKADTVYIVGDLVWEKADPLKYIQRLNGRKVLITGNHDKKWLAKQDCSTYFEQIVPYLEIKSSNVDITLCHYPMLEWKNSRKLGSKKLGYLIHGHIHNRYRDDYKSVFMMPHALNAGGDINGFVPVTLSELIKNNETYKLSKLTSMVDKAEFLASKYHLYQLDRAGKPYIEHPRTVSRSVADEKEKVIALLHDTLEDTDIDINLLRSLFTEEIVEAIETLTHKEEEEYFEYVRRIARNSLAKQVKKADLHHNMDLTRLKQVGDKDLARVEKYKKALSMLDENSSEDSEYDIFDKVLERLKEYSVPQKDILAIEMLFERISDILSERKILANKQKYIAEYNYTRYIFRAHSETALKKALKEDTYISYTLGCKNGIRVLDNRENLTFTIEVPNECRNTLWLRTILSKPIKDEKVGGRYFPIGLRENNAIYADLTKLPHLLLAGTSGSGKSVIIHDILVSLIARYSPQELKFVLIDPKQIEFNVYNGLPHLYEGKIFTDFNAIFSVMEKMRSEMENRYELFSQNSVRDINGYNKIAQEKGWSVLPKIAIIIDEFADIMLVDKKRIEKLVAVLAMKSRAAGIHMIISTQRPSADTISGTVKACLPSRIACRVCSWLDSRIILDEDGAELLMGNGDVLYRSAQEPNAIRLQAPYVSMQEIKLIVDLIKEEYEKK